VLSTLLTIAAVVAGLSALAGLIFVAARRLRLFRTERATVQLRAIAEPDTRRALNDTPAPRHKQDDQTGAPQHAGTPQLRETSVPAWASRVIAIERPVIQIGRAAHNDIVLSEDGVSAEHCRLEREGDTFRLTDLGSTNRTWVNGEEATSQLLRPGDEIRVGQTRFVLEWTAAKAANENPQGS